MKSAKKDEHPRERGRKSAKKNVWDEFRGKPRPGREFFGYFFGWWGGIAENRGLLVQLKKQPRTTCLFNHDQIQNLRPRQPWISE